MSGDRNNLIDTITGMFVPVHRDGHKFIFAAAIATLLLFLIVPPLGWVGAVLTAWCAYFFRDPERVTPVREGLVVSGADGRVVASEEVIPPREIGLGEARRTRISVFLSVFDVHIVRAPFAGRVVRSVYVPGQFLNAELDKASEDNERRTFVFEAPNGEKVAMAMIAGLVARRIVTFVEEGASVAAGERVGLIRFGSRVDVYLPQGAQPLVAVGQRAIGGETVFADMTSAEPARAFRTD